MDDKGSLHSEIELAFCCPAELSDIIELANKMAGLPCKDQQSSLRLNMIRSNLSMASSTDNIKFECIFVELYAWYYAEYLEGDIPTKLEKKNVALFYKRPENAKVYSLEQLLSRGWTVEGVMRQAVKISEESIAGYLPTDNESMHWSTLRKKNLELYLGLVFCGNLIGQVGAVALLEAEYIKMKLCKLKEQDIVGDTPSAQSPARFLYVPSIVIKSQYRNFKLLSTMLRKWILLITTTRLIDQEECRLLVCPYTKEGIRIAKMFGLEPVCTGSSAYGEIWEASVSQLRLSKIGARYLKGTTPQDERY
jgi:hypothetical protein